MSKVTADGGRPQLFVGVVHVFVLTAFAVAQPLFDILARNAGFFVARHSPAVDILALIVFLLLLLPLPLVLAEVLAWKMGARVHLAVHGVLVAVLVAAICLPPLNRAVDLWAGLMLGLALLAGMFTATIYLRSSLVRKGLSFLALSLFIFPLFFVFRPSIRSIVFAGGHARLSSAHIGNPAPMVMVIFDELPLTSLLDDKGAIDPRRYPNFAALGSTATWFRNASAVSDDTLKAVPAILTGKYPQPGLLAIFKDHPENLFTLLGGSYRLKVFEDYTELCPPALCRDAGEQEGEQEARRPLGFGQRMASLLRDVSVVYLHLILPRDWRGSLPAIHLDWKSFGSNDRWHSRIGGFTDLLETLRPASEPTLYFVHVGLPHAPYFWYPSGKVFSKTGREPAAEGWQYGKWVQDDWIVLQSYQRHLLQLGFADHMLGRLLTRLKQADLFDPALIVVVADHGSSFRPGVCRRRLTENNYIDIMSVPLLIKRPFQTTGTTDDRNVELIDILPTVADVLEIDGPWQMDGRSVYGREISERDDKICYSADEKMTFPFASFREKGNALSEKLRHFGTGERKDGLYKIGPHAIDLVGRHVDEMNDSGNGGASAQLVNGSLFGNVDPESDFLPGEVVGHVELPDEIVSPLSLAVAVNGVIRATTQTYGQDSPRKTASWSALLDEDSFIRGSNRVEVFIIHPNGDSFKLQRTGELRGSPYMNVNLGVSPIPGVGSGGFLPREVWGDRGPVRWTRKEARLSVPIDLRNPPVALKIELLWTGPHDVKLRVRVNGEQVVEQAFGATEWPGSPWMKTVSLENVPLRGRATIELLAEKPTEEDRGVAVSGIWLLRRSDLPE